MRWMCVKCARFTLTMTVKIVRQSGLGVVAAGDVRSHYDCAGFTHTPEVVVDWFCDACN